jgi:hypothetical protein
VNLASTWLHQDSQVVYANWVGGLEVALGEAVHQVRLERKRVWVRPCRVLSWGFRALVLECDANSRN